MNIQVARRTSTWVSLVVRVMVVAVLAVNLVFYVHQSIGWQMLVDSPVMHYVNFLMDHGMRPYQEITDNNFPGAYLTEGWAMHLFGPGDLAWRFYDYFLLITLTASMVVIAWPYDRVAGFYAGGLFALRHGSEGPWFAGEREQAIAAFLVASCALLFLAVRNRRPALVGGFGLVAAMAASIKPTIAPFTLIALLLLFLELRRQRLPPKPYLVWGVAGLVTSLSINVAFLLRHQAFYAFFRIIHLVTFTYIGLNKPGLHFLIRHVLPDELLPLIPFGLLGLVLHRKWNWEFSVLALAAAFGLFSYFLQGKGFFHHRYIFLSFVLLLISIEIFSLLRGSLSMRLVGAWGLLIPLLLAVRGYNHQLRVLPGRSLLTETLEADLQQFGGTQLQNGVQCFDLTFGCLSTLYHLGLVENTGYTGDLLLFQPAQSAATAYYRSKLLQLEAHHPASVLVVTNEDFGKPNSFDRLREWPAFVDDLKRNYDLVIARSFPREDRLRDQGAAPTATAPAYRIYVRRSSPKPRL